VGINWQTLSKNPPATPSKRSAKAVTSIHLFPTFTLSIIAQADEFKFQETAMGTAPILYRFGLVVSAAIAAHGLVSPSNSGTLESISL
jgi:hypothetical protein